MTIRLNTAHRATNDVDAVVEDNASRDWVLEYLADNPHTERLEIDGVKVNIMATNALTESADELRDEELPRLFVLAHRWALESASAVSVRTTSGSSGALVVATLPALVACKFHAIADRRGPCGQT